MSPREIDSNKTAIMDLTAQSESINHTGRQASAEVEITEEMIAAGIHELAYYYPDDPDHDQETRRAVMAIYKAMTAVRPADASR